MYYLVSVVVGSLVSFVGFGVYGFAIFASGHSEGWCFGLHGFTCVVCCFVTCVSFVVLCCDC